ncbi:MAG: hypothetical protein ACXWA9_13195 [Acidimicrobiia bacterium]
MPERSAFVVETELELGPGADRRASGGAVTTALCGHWEHDGPCRWPHHTAIDVSEATARVRTVVVTDAETRADVTRRIETALRADDRWTVLGCRTDRVGPAEVSLARSLAGSG